MGDRYIAVRWPIKYKQLIMPVRIMTGILLTITWLLGLIIALVPIFNPRIRYAFAVARMIIGVPNDTLVSYKEQIADGSVTLYACVIIIPLVIVWCVNGLTIWEIVGEQCCNCLHRRTKVTSRRPSAFGHEKDQNKSQTFEMRIAKTFLSMTTAFTVALVPIGIATLWLPLAERSGQIDPTSDKYDPSHTVAWSSFDFVAGLFLLCNSFHNCI